MHLGSKAATCSLDPVLLRKMLFYKQIVKWLAIVEDNIIDLQEFPVAVKLPGIMETIFP